MTGETLFFIQESYNSKVVILEAWVFLGRLSIIANDSLALLIIANIEWITYYNLGGALWVVFTRKMFCRSV